MVHELTTAQTATIATTVPWFLKNMPASYFRQTSYNTRLEHVKAIAALKDTEMELSLDIKSKLPNGGRVLTYIRPENKTGLLLALLKGLPVYEGKILSRVQLYTTEDNSMCLNMFSFAFGCRELSR